jgi:hypothetical protein
MKLFFKNFWPGIIWLCIILALTLAPGNYFPRVGNFWNLFSPDKLIHLSIFTVLAYLLLWGSFKQYSAVKNRYTIVIPVVVTIFTGIVTELLQALLPIGREASIYDSIANFAGCFAGYLIFTLRKNKSGKNTVAN